MNGESMSLKAKIRNYAKNSHIAAQVVLQNFMFERFLLRLSQSEYRDKFVIKGGMLIASIVGLDIRSTMDLDTTLKGLPLTKERILEAVSKITEIDPGDGVSFKIISAEPIRKDDHYGGYRLRLDALYDAITTPLSVDVSTGDVITPAAVRYEISGMFDETLRISLWGYNIETILAEKVETILSRGVFNTRPRDYYDVYILASTQKFDKKLFLEALEATAAHRGTTESIADKNAILEQIGNNETLKILWEKYRQKFSYAGNVRYQDIIAVLENVLGTDSYSSLDSKSKQKA